MTENKQIIVEIDPYEINIIKEDLKEYMLEYTETESPTFIFLKKCIEQLVTPKNGKLTVGEATHLQEEIKGSKMFDIVYVKQLNNESTSHIVICKKGEESLPVHSIKEWNQFKTYPVNQLLCNFGGQNA